MKTGLFGRKILSLYKQIIIIKKIEPQNFIAAAAAKSLQSDSVRPQRRQPTRPPCPWDSPGKNTGMGCHFLLQCMKVKSESEVAQSCPTPRDPMDCSPPGFSVHGIFQARVLEWGGIAFSGYFSQSSAYLPCHSSHCILTAHVLLHKTGLLKESCGQVYPVSACSI